MPPYKSIPNDKGSSKSLDKLRALRIPPLAGLSFLDASCNEGFFCGFAQHQGAGRILGLDNNRHSIEHAKATFPGIEFKCQSWDEPIKEKFDVILLASALHYAKNQQVLIHKLLSSLTPSGTLILEVGMVNEPGDKWVTVKRCVDERQFPTRSKIASMLKAHAWKIIGPSVNQANDPLSWVVVHVQNRRPYAFLLMSRSGYGKTSISRALSTARDLVHVSGDTLMQQISEGKVTCQVDLQTLIIRSFATDYIAAVVREILTNDLLDHWVDAWLDKARKRNVIIDSYVPKRYWPHVIKRIEERGFVPIQLTWDLMGPKLHDACTYDKITKDYVRELSGRPISKQWLFSKYQLLADLLNIKTKHTSPSISDAALPADFDPQEYLRLHPDVARAGMDPAKHYLIHGILEGRRYKDQ